MSDGMSDARDYGPSLSKHGPPLISKNGKPFEQDVETGTKCHFCGLISGHSNACIDVQVRVERDQWKERALKAEKELETLREKSKPGQEAPEEDDSGFPTAQDLKIHNAVREFFGGCKRHGIEDCRTCKEIS